jgi:hypothetical protein
MSSHRPLRIFMVLAFSVVSLAVTAGEAQACSCASAEPRDAIAQFDASFVGTVLERSGSGVVGGFFGGEDSTFIFAVDTDVGGNLGSEVEVHSSSLCGLEVDEGDRVGLFLTLNADEVWTSNLCSQIAPDVLLRAGAPLPAPDGMGPIRFLLGGNFGEARLMSVDGRGRTLAYGYGPGEVYDIDVCPGGRRSVETVTEGRTGSLVVRDVRSLEILREVPLVEAKFPSIYVVACLDQRADHLLAIDDVGGVRVHEIVGGEASVVFSSPGRAWGSTIEGGVPYLTLSGRRFGRLDVRSGRFQSIVRLPEHTDGARLSPDGRWVASVRYGGARPGEPPSDIMLISTRNGSIRTTPLVFWNDGGWIQWLSANRFLFLPIGEDVDRIAIYDVPSLEELVGADEWYAGEAVVRDGVVYGTNGYQLSRVRLGIDDVTTVLREFDGPVYALAHVPGRERAQPSPPPPTTARSHVTGPPVSDRGFRLWVVLAAALVAAAGVAFGLSRRARGSEPIEV